jgi:hypothetical protein
MRLLIVLVILLCSYCSSFHISHRALAAAVRSQVHRELPAAKIEELSDDGGGEVGEEVTTHGYEGDFKVGDLVKVAINTKMYHVKQHSKTGFDPHGFVGRVDSLALYGRKFKTLCSAITPVKVKFSPEDPSIPAGMFDRAWIGHFAGDELELVSRATE